MEIVDEVRLHCCRGGSDKVYRIVVEKHTDGLGSPLMPMYRVMAYWGRRTSPNSGQQEKMVTPSPGGAIGTMHELMGEKVGRGYVLLPTASTPRVVHAPVHSQVKLVALDAPRKGKSHGPKETSPASGRRLRI
jgi:hypothetical protein